MTLMNLQQRAIRGVFWSAMRLWGARFFQFLVLVILSHLLTPEDFGLVAMASLFLTFTQIFVDQGFAYAIIQRPEIEKIHLDTAFWANVFSGVLLTLIIISIAGMIAQIYHEPRLTPIIQVLSLSFVCVGLVSVQEAILSRQLAFKQLALRTLIATIIGGLVGISCAVLGFGAWSLVAQSLTQAFVGVIVLWNVSKWRPGFHFSKKHFSEMFLFGYNLLLIDIMNFINRHIDDLLVGYFLGPVMLGYYTIAYTIIRRMTELLTSVTNAVAFPTFSRLQDNLEKMRKAYYKVTQYTSFISFPAFIGVAILAPLIVPIIFGEQWVLSIPVMQILAFIGIIHSLFYFNGSVIVAVGKPSWQLILVFLKAVTNFIFFLFAVRWGIIAVATAYVIHGYLFLPIDIWVMKKLIFINVKTYLSQFKAPLVSTFVMAVFILGLGWLLRNVATPLTQLIILIVSGASVYLITFQLFYPTFIKQFVQLLSTALPDSPYRKS